MQQLSHETEQDLGGQIENFADQFTIALQVSQLKGVIAVRLFDAQGKFVAPFPAYVAETTLDEKDFQELKKLRPVSHFYPAARLADLFLEEPKATRSPSKTAPLLQVVIPLHRKDQAHLLGIIQFVNDGQSIAAEFAALDRNLFLQAAIAFLAGGIMIVAVLGWAFRRLQASNRRLMERTASLWRANEELALVAKTSAVGALTAHLIHGLRNPLSGLENFVVNQGRENPAGTDPDWQDALATARRMQSLIGEIVRVLGEENRINEYEISLAELVEIITAKVKPVAKTAGVQLNTCLKTEGVLANRQANLVLLILENLIQNAIQATPRSKSVELVISRDGENVTCEVKDEGPGVPATLLRSLFAPCRSTKPGGSGIGLAICKQFANHLEAGLELKSSTPSGCVFALSLRCKNLSEKTTLVSQALLG
jgi:signal transduction histidine kinase